MIERRPPRLADSLLRRLGLSSRNEPLIGDILEEFRQGRSAGWYWRQTIGAIATTFRQRFWIVRRDVAAFLVAWLADFLVVLTPRIFGVQPDFRIVAGGAAVFLTLVLLMVLKFWLDVRQHPEARRVATRDLVGVLLVWLADVFVVLTPWIFPMRSDFRIVSGGAVVFLVLSMLMCLEFGLRAWNWRHRDEDDDPDLDQTMERSLKPRIRMILYFFMLVSIDSLCFLTAILFPFFRTNLLTFAGLHLLWFFQTGTSIVWEARDAA